jgi:hypothetical protein
VSIDFLGLVMREQEPKFQLEFKRASINFDLNCQLDHLQET